MKRFLINIGLFLVIIFILVIIGVCVIPKNTSHFLYAHHTKMSRLDTLSGPRLIIIGGSNVIFGLNSQEIEDKLKIHVQNAGLQAPIGLRFMLDDVSNRVQEGDTIIIMPEYQQFYNLYNGEANGLPYAALYSGWKSLKYLNNQQFQIFIAGLPKYIMGNIMASKPKGNLYSIESFNEWGDVTFHWNQSIDNSSVVCSTIAEPFNSYAAEDLQAKIEDLKKRGVETYLLWPVTIQSNYDKNRRALEEITKELKKRGINFENSPDSFVQPDSLAFDTQYHVNYQGVENVTKEFIRQFQKLRGREEININDSSVTVN